MVLVGQVSRFEIGFNGGDWGFDFVRGVGDEDFLGFVGGFDGANGLFGEEVGEDGDDSLDTKPGDEQSEKKGVQRGFAVGADAVVDDLAEGSRSAVVLEEFDGGFERGGFARLGGVFGDEVDGGESGDENE